MSNKRQATFLWVVAVVVTLSSVVYQRVTGPTYPVDGQLTQVMDSQRSTIEYSLPASENTGADAEVRLEVGGDPVQATLMWKRMKSHDDWSFVQFEAAPGGLIAYLPMQPAAGKLVYGVEVEFADGKKEWLTPEPVTIRFKGGVPIFVLLPHILLMFTSMLVSTRTGLAAWANSEATVRYAWVTFVTLMIGGMILGPIVQKYAFDAFWTGWPFGQDLTDNKTLVAVLAWIVAFWRHYRTGRARGWFIVAAIVQLLIYLIPHSVLGSELDYTQIEG